MAYSFLRVWDAQGMLINLDIHDEPRIDAAVTEWVDSGRTKDTVLHLTTLEGVPYTTLASNMVAWAHSTPESRKAFAHVNQAMLNEQLQLDTDHAPDTPPQEWE